MSQAGIQLVEEGQRENASPPPRAPWRAILSSNEGRAGLGLFVIVLAIILFGPLIRPYPPAEIGVGLDNAPPSPQNLLGTDQLGRDVLSRFLTGGLEVILIPLVAVGLAVAVGAGLGMLGAFRGGLIDTLITRVFDLILTLPPLLSIIVMVAAFGTSTVVVVLAIALVYIPQFGRLIRGASQVIVASDYVAAALARGERTGAILLREILPNVATPVLAAVALRLTFAIMFIATLDFLGLGSQPPSSAWGLMVSDGQKIITVAPLVALVPIVGIAALCVSFNLIADAISRYLRHEI